MSLMCTVWSVTIISCNAPKIEFGSDKYFKNHDISVQNKRRNIIYEYFMVKEIKKTKNKSTYFGIWYGNIMGTK